MDAFIGRQEIMNTKSILKNENPGSGELSLLIENIPHEKRWCLGIIKGTRLQVQMNAF